MASTESGSGDPPKIESVQKLDTPANMTAEVSNAAPRENMIETAIQFLQNPQVRTGPLSQKRAFLQKKGLTAQEIEIAIERSGTKHDVAPAVVAKQPPSNQLLASPQGVQMHQQMVPYGQPMPLKIYSWRDYTAIAVIVGGVSYGIYKLIQNFLMPFFKSRQEERERLGRLEASIQELNKSVAQTIEKLETTVVSIRELLDQQQTKLDSLTDSVVTGRALTSHNKSGEMAEVKAEITSLKGLLLNRHQFPAIPQPSPIPAWQRASTPPDSTPTKQTANIAQPDSNPTKTETRAPPVDSVQEEEALSNGDLGNTGQEEKMVNGDVTTDAVIHENAATGEGNNVLEPVVQTQIAQEV